MSRLDVLLAEVAAYQGRLESHPVYARAVFTRRDLAGFMETHVWAVWDFMTLLKSLQKRLTCVTLPWIPAADAECARLVNEIVLAEESDLLPDGRIFSHFELYLAAMREVGASTGAIRDFLGGLKAGDSLPDALVATRAPTHAAAFVRTTWEMAQARAHETAAAFLLGREDLVPRIFRPLLRNLEAQESFSAPTFALYLDRHIALDGDDHGPRARRLLEKLCGEDEAKWSEAARAAERSLKAREALWDGLIEEENANRCSTGSRR